MKTLRVMITLVAVCSLPGLVWAQWQWIDKDGRRVFSDRAPPPDIPAKSILKQPGARPAEVAAAPAASGASGAQTAQAAPAAASAARPGASLPRLSGKDKELEDKRKQAEAAEAEKKKAEEEKQAQARAENCRRAKQGKMAFDSGQRIATVNEKGERIVLDDQQRAAETKRLEGIIARDCVQAQQ